MAIDMDAFYCVSRDHIEVAVNSGDVTFKVVNTDNEQEAIAAAGKFVEGLVADYSPAVDIAFDDDVHAGALSHMDHTMQTEQAHKLADNILLNVLKRHGYVKTVAAFEAMDKWYA